MKKLLLIVLLALSLNADGLENTLYNGWSDKNADKFNLFMGLQALDVVSTHYVIKGGKGTESNTLLYGSNPKLKDLLLAKAILIPVVYTLLEFQNEEWKGYTLNVVNTMYVAIGANNIAIGAGIKF